MIRLENVSLQYEGRTVLEQISTTFESHAFTAIVGTNGAGKSSLLKVIAGIISLAGGVISYEGQPLHQIASAERARLIAYLPQSRPIPEMTALMMIQHGRFPHLGFSKTLSPRDRAAVDTAIAMTDTAPLLEKKVGRLSGGERQRVYLAMAIAQNTDVLLLDEPATHLDLRYQLELYQILKQLHQQGKTILMVGQDLPQAFTFASRVCVIQQGRVVCHDTPAFVQRSRYLPDVFGFSLQPVPENDDMLYHYYIAAKGNSA